MIRFINQKYPDANIVLLSDTKSKDLNEKLLSSFSQAKSVDNIQGIQKALVKEATNIVFVSSDDVVFLSDAIRILYNVAGISGRNRNYNIIMATLEKGDAYDHNSISNTQLSALKFTYPAANRYAGESSSFIKKYYKTYKTSPTKYAFRGFDLTMDAVLRTSLEGNFLKEANLGETSYQENKFQYIKVSHGLVDLAMCLLAAHFLFEVPMRGSLGMMVLGGTLYLVVSLLMGLFISGRMHNQFLASQVALLGSLLPSMMLSGFIFDLRNSPQLVQITGHLLSATHFMGLTKSLFLMGNHWPTLMQDLGILLIYAVLLLWVTLRTVRKRLD